MWKRNIGVNICSAFVVIGILIFFYTPFFYTVIWVALIALLLAFLCSVCRLIK